MRNEWTFVMIILAVSLIVSVVCIFQLMDKVAELEITVVEQTKILAEAQKVGG